MGRKIVNHPHVMLVHYPFFFFSSPLVQDRNIYHKNSHQETSFCNEEAATRWDLSIKK